MHERMVAGQVEIHQKWQTRPQTKQTKMSASRQAENTNSNKQDNQLSWRKGPQLG